MAKPWLMGFDLGGSGVRCLLINSDSGATSCTTQRWQYNTAPGTFGTGCDIDLHNTWELVSRASRQALLQAGVRADEVGGVSVAAMRYSSVFMGNDANAVLATPNRDARAAGECFELADQYGEQLLASTGTWPLPLHAGPRLLYLKAQQPENFASVETLYSIGDWLNEKLVGVRATDPTQACATGLFSLQDYDWCWEFIDQIDFPRNMFPPVIPAGTQLGELGASTAQHLGLAEGTPVSMGGADTQAALVGAGAIVAGDIAVVAGTTAPVQQVVAQPWPDTTSRFVSTAHLLPNHWLVESNGGALGETLTLMARLLFPDAREPELRLLAEAAQSAAGAAGVLSTLGAQQMDMRAPTLPVGQISLSHMNLMADAAPRTHLARSVIEGHCYGLRANIDQLLAASDTQQSVSDIHLCGGISRSDIFSQLLCDVLNRAVVTPRLHQTTALGAAICAGVGSQHFTDFPSACDALSHSRARFQPQAKVTGTYQSQYVAWQRYREANEQHSAPIAVEHVLPMMLQEPPIPASPPALHAQLSALITAAFDEDSLAELGRNILIEYASFREVKRLLTGPDLVQALSGKQIFVTEVDVVNVDALALLPDLRVVAACRGDAVNVDVEACTAFGIPVLFAPGRNAIAVADLTVGFILNLARKLPAASSFLKQADCTAGNMGKMGQAFSQLRGRELWRKTIGLIGLGAVGRAVAARLAGFDAEILVADPFVTTEQAALAGCKLVDLPLLLASSDIVSLHAAVTPETKGMIGAQEFAQMKPGAFFINTARAALIDEDALVQALEQGHLGGAALDTFAVEPPGFDHPLLQLPNVIATPHSAGNTEEVASHQGQSISTAISQLLRGETPTNVLNPGTLDSFSWQGSRPQPTERELAKLREKKGPAVSDLQRDTKADSKLGASSTPPAQVTAPAKVVDGMRAILSEFCSALAADTSIQTFSAGQDVTLHFHIHDLGLSFFISLNNGEVTSALGTPENAAEVQLEMRGEIVDGMFTGTIDTMECAMNGEISFMGDAAKAMTLQHMNDDMERLYTAARAKMGDPGDLAAVPRSDVQVAATASDLAPGDIREELVEIMQELFDAQVITATGGNISARIPDNENELWITPSRLFKGDLKPEVMVRINLDGESLETGARSPSSEWCMHTKILARKSEAKAVIHAHAPNATILANAGLPFLPISTEAAFFGNIPRVPFIMPGTNELAEAVSQAMEDEWAVLMVNHGIIVAGRSLRRAADMVEIIERTAEVILGCYAVGKEPPVLPADAAAHFRKLGDIVA